MINLQQVCKSLEQKRCCIHNQNPVAVVKGELINLTCCCEDFQKKLETQIDVEVGKQFDKSVDDAFRGLGDEFI